jgi:hypothetical protein
MSSYTPDMIYVGLGIFLISIIPAFISKKFGLAFSFIFCIIFIFFGFGTMLILSSSYPFWFLVCPSLTWLGFWFGNFIRKKMSN